jgi:hypothetical protein
MLLAKQLSSAAFRFATKKNTFPATALFSTGKYGPGDTKLYELRTYTLKPEHLMDYLALTGGDAFTPRTEASKCNGFFVLEMGDTLNAVCHLWEYESFDHRTDVRAKLAGDTGFGEYIGTIRPWLVSQHSVMTEGWFDTEFCEGADNGSGRYLLQKFNPAAAHKGGDELGDGCKVVGNFTTLVGTGNDKFTLTRASSFEGLTPAFSNAQLGSTMLIPSGFSLAQ